VSIRAAERSKILQMRVADQPAFALGPFGQLWMIGEQLIKERRCATQIAQGRRSHALPLARPQREHLRRGAIARELAFGAQQWVRGEHGRAD
jgi:hypothetical protein